MRDGFVNVSCLSPKLCVADTQFNKNEICRAIDNVSNKNVNIAVFPELCVTGCSCADLYYSDVLLSSVKNAIKEICNYTLGKYPVVIVGAPIKYNNNLYNCAIVIQNGKILGVVPKSNILKFSSNNECRYFCSANDLNYDCEIIINEQKVPFGNNIIFKHNELENYTFAVEIGDDSYGSFLQTEKIISAGAIIIANLSGYNEAFDTTANIISVLKANSLRMSCAYLLSNAGVDESTQDGVCSGNQMVIENGEVIDYKPPFSINDKIVTQIDVDLLSYLRTQKSAKSCVSIRTVYFEQSVNKTKITRSVCKNPFLPNSNEQAELILNTQAYGLKKRIVHSNSKTVVIGISGGLDSTLAILVAVRAMNLCDKPLSDIIAVTMPCFGTSQRTKSNAVLLCENLGVTLKEVNITKSVSRHFKDIGHNGTDLDVTYENAQARERTQVLMDIANMCGGLVIGTGDLSELALGWATYNGDHMSMYSVNASIPKTLVKYLVKYEAEKYNEMIARILLDIIDTPVSPELLPTNNVGKISQKTEDLVGPYELHDFFIYHMLKHGFNPSKIYRIACVAHNDKYDRSIIHKWLKVFVKRFFIQQFKRTCIPDGPKATQISLSPRSDWRMPSDVSYNDWIKEVDEIEVI